jgi:D-3-phosphoglycerate dehydrogenase
MRYRILTLNHISDRGLEHLSPKHYEVGPQVTAPDAILVRSADMHAMDIPTSVLAIARAGAGVNNIPVAELSQRGVPVFNAPGANANAVKELVLTALFLAARNIGPAMAFARSLTGDDAAIDEAVERGKKQFVGFELPGRTLGVLGLGAVGVEVANAAISLGMTVVGYDPQITVHRAWQLSSSVEQALSLHDLFARADVVSVHVPLNAQTRNLVNESRLKLMRRGGVLLNFARSQIVETRAVTGALDAGWLRTYVCDFPCNALKNHPKVLALPHLGASTNEAEDNCAIMVAEALRDFLENGNVRHAVNYPESILSRAANTTRLAIANNNVPNMVGQISTHLASAGLNIADLLNKSRGEYAYTLIDTEGSVNEELVASLRRIEGVLSARMI